MIITCLFLTLLVYVNADVYTITVNEISPQSEETLSVTDSADFDVGKEKNCSGRHTVVRASLEDTPLYDGLCRYKNGEDVITKKPVMFCNTDITDIGGTAINILYNALGFEDQQPCPIDPETFCAQAEFKLTSGNFEGIFTDDVNQVDLEIEMDGIINAKFSISKEEGLPVPPQEDDPSDEANGPPSETQEMENEAAVDEPAADEEVPSEDGGEENQEGGGEESQEGGGEESQEGGGEESQEGGGEENQEGGGEESQEGGGEESQEGGSEENQEGGGEESQEGGGEESQEEGGEESQEGGGEESQEEGSDDASAEESSE